VQKEYTYAELSQKIHDLNGHVFFVSGKSYDRTKIIQKLKISAIASNVDRFSDFTENPTLDEVVQGVIQYQQSNAKMIIALGGGTAIDIAKLIKHYSQIEFDIDEPLDRPPKVVDSLLDISLIAIPTTFGTGSESTHFAVLYVKGQKFSIAEHSVLPNGYLLDSQFAKTMPVTVKGAALLDALCQAIESFWNKNRTKQSVCYAKEAITMIVRHFKTYMQDDNNIGNIQIAKATNLAGKAINITKTTAPHALSYTLTSNHNVSHGHAVAICLRNMFEINENKAKLSNDINTSSIMNELYELLNVEDADGSKSLINEFLKISKLETQIEKLGVISSKEVNLIVDNVNLERLENHPVKLSSDDLELLLIN